MQFGEFFYSYNLVHSLQIIIHTLHNSNSSTSAMHYYAALLGQAFKIPNACLITMKWYQSTQITLQLNFEETFSKKQRGRGCEMITWCLCLLFVHLASFQFITQISIDITCILVDKIWNVHPIFFTEKEGPVDPDFKLLDQILFLFI